MAGTDTLNNNHNNDTEHCGLKLMYSNIGINLQQTVIVKILHNAKFNIKTKYVACNA